MALGVAFVYSASATVNSELTFEKLLSSPPLRNMLYFPAAIVLIYLFAWFDYRRFDLQRRWYRSISWYVLAAAIVLLTLVLIPSPVSREVNHARRWLFFSFGGFSMSFQPSELGKWAIIIFLAAWLDRYCEQMKDFLRRFLPACLAVGAVVGLIILEDTGTAAFVCVLSFLLLVVGRADWRHLLSLLIPLPGLIAYVAVSKPYVLERIRAWLDPAAFASTTGYQAGQSVAAISSGQLWGMGIGMGVSKYGHLPEDTTDFVFAVIAEELGFVGAGMVILMYTAFLLLGLLVIIRCKDRFGKLLGTGIVFAICLQAAVNIAVVTVVLPTKGIPLPFISAGGTSMLLTAAAVGILISIARHSDQQSDTAAVGTISGVGDE